MSNKHPAGYAGNQGAGAGGSLFDICLAVLAALIAAVFTFVVSYR
jgi:hypothetical protein